MTWATVITRFALALLLMVGSGCTGSTVHPDRPTTRRASASAIATESAPSPVASPTPLILPAIQLIADIQDKPRAWDRAAFIPFGDGVQELGFHHFEESVDSLPSSFAVDADGSLWVVDRWKDRIAHYSAQGTFLDGIRLSPVRRATDMAIVERRMFVIVYEQGGVLNEVHGRGRLTPVTLRVEGRSLYTYELFGTPLGLVANVAGFYDSIDSGTGVAGTVGYVLVDPRTGSLESLPGIPTGRGTYVRASGQESAEEDSTVTFASDGAVTIQPLRIRMRVHHGGTTRTVPALAGFFNLLPTADDLYVFARVLPQRSADAARYGGGRWLLRLGKSPIVWERLPDPGTPDELQHRHLALGPDGSLYQMVAQEDGEVILRRP